MDLSGEHKYLIAVLDRDTAVLDYLKRTLSGRYDLILLSEVAQLNQRLRQSPVPDLLLMDGDVALDESGEDAVSLLADIRAAKPSLPVIMLACSVELQWVVAVTRLGASDILLKPFRKEDIENAIQQCLDELDMRPTGQEVKEIPLDENTSFVRSCKRMRDIETQCTLVARADIPVLILGESGTGKEIAAKLIHKFSGRSQKTFLKVNCAAMPADLLESELFGYEQGAFTGAIKSKPGKFEICNGGTILLDEIGEMPTILQAKLLQVLQDGTFSRLGGRSNIKVDVRVIAATNIDIKQSMAQKTFREDLYYRLNGFTLNMPPLRERLEEIPAMARQFMQKVSTKYGTDPLNISRKLVQALSSYSWPGNLREMENVIKRYLVLGDEQTIINELCPRDSVSSLAASEESADTNNGLKLLVRNVKGGAESVAIKQSLEGHGWNRKAAAYDLQISYKALLYKIKQYNLVPPQKQRPQSLPQNPPTLRATFRA